MNELGTAQIFALVRPAPEDVAIADLTAITAWVASKRESEHTRRAFRTEAQRYLCWLIAYKADEGHTTFLDKARAIDAAAYARFLTMAPKPEFPAWALELARLDRQPFKNLTKIDRDGQAVPVPLSAAAVERAISTLKAMYADLIAITAEQPYTIVVNPFVRIKTKTVVSKGSPRLKGLNEAERRYVDTALETMLAEGNARYHQCRWIWSALKWTALRRHELANARAGDIYQDSDEHGASVWMIRVLGKGGKEASVPLSDDFMKEFRQYREYHGLPQLPVHQINGEPEATPLVLPIRGAAREVNDKMVYRAMKSLMERAADVAMEAGNPASSGRLRTFAAHSARHTSITTIVDATGDITLGQDLARHASITTTRGYKAKAVSRLKAALQDLKTL